LQIIMVPTDGKNFFANDVMRSALSGNIAPQAVDPPDDAEDAPRPASSTQRKPNGRH